MALLPDTDLNGAQSIAQALVTAMADSRTRWWGRSPSARAWRPCAARDNGAAMLRRRGDAALCEPKGRDATGFVWKLDGRRALRKQAPCQCLLDTAPASSTGASKYGRSWPASSCKLPSGAWAASASRSSA